MQFVIVFLIVRGTIAGRETTNPIVLSIIPDTSLILKTYWEIKDFKKKIELCRFAFTILVKTLTELRSFLRGVPFDKERYLDQLKTVDNIIIDMCSLVDAFEQQ